jgi:hypothetical protein
MTNDYAGHGLGSLVTDQEAPQFVYTIQIVTRRKLRAGHATGPTPSSVTNRHLHHNVIRGVVQHVEKHNTNSDFHHFLPLQHQRWIPQHKFKALQWGPEYKMLSQHYL